MKLLVFSDVHRNRSRLENILTKHNDADLVISLGDTELKASYLNAQDIIAIKGNYPFDPGHTYEHEMTIGQRKFLFTHGHKYNVRSGIEKLYEKMVDLDVDIAMYGHTHIAAFDVVEKRMLVNPGSVHRSRNEQKESYMIVLVEEGQVGFNWYSAEDHGLIREVTR